MKLTLIRLGVIGALYLVFKYVVQTGVGDALVLAYVTEYIIEPWLTSKV